MFMPFDIAGFYSRHKLEVWVLVIALAARVTLFSVNFSANHGQLLPTIHGDDGYYELSQSLMAGHGFSFSAAPPYLPNSLRPPVWPITIAAVASAFGSYWAVAIFEILIGSLTALIGMRIAQRLFGRRKLSFGVGILLALEPYAVLLSTNMYTETMFTFFFLLSFLFFIRYFDDKSLRNAVWTGVFLGLAILIKPTVEYIPFILPFFILWCERKHLTRETWKHMAAFAVVCGAIVSIWLYRNYREFGAVAMSAQPSFNLYVYMVPTVLAIDNHTDFKTELAKFVYSKPDFNLDTITLANQRQYKDAAIAILKDHKTALLKSVGTTLVTFFTHDGMLTVLSNAGYAVPNTLTAPALTLLLRDPIGFAGTVSRSLSPGGWIILVTRMAWVLMTLLFFIGAWIYLRKEKAKPYAWAALLLVAYFALTTAVNGLGVNARFRVPVETFIFSFALYGLSRLWQAMSRGSLRFRKK